MSSLDFKQVLNAVTTNAAAFRCRRTLQPGGGPGTKVFPPTYAGAVYAVEQRRLPGREQPVTCVLLDSVQSQANRMEEALQQAIDEGKLKLPLIEADFSGADLIEPVSKITSLQAPHRIADAILRDSELNGTRFRESEIGKTIDSAGPLNATPIYKLCPTALVFGMWDSTGPKGGLGIKIERAMVSEIVGIDAFLGTKTSSRIDPLGITKSAGPVYAKKGSDGHDWTLTEKEAELEKGKPVLFGGNKEAKKRGNPAALNHGNVVPDLSDRDGRPLAGGVTLESAEQTITLSVIALRRLRFPVNGKVSQEIDVAARAVLTALGLCAATLSAEKGLDLRSRCLLWPDGPMQWELLAKPGEAPQTFALDSDGAIKLLADAVAHAAKAGLKWEEKPITLKPSKPLVELVRKSQEQAARGEGEEGGG